MRAAYRALAGLIAVGVAIQIAAIALAGFMVADDAQDGVAIDSAYSNLGQAVHGWGGNVIGVLALVLLILSFLTRVPRGRTLAGIVFGLVVLQMVLAIVAFGIPAIGILHGLNGLAIAAVAGMASRRAAVPAPAHA